MKENKEISNEEILKFIKNEMSVIENMTNYLREICGCQKFPMPSFELKRKKGIKMEDNSVFIWGALEKYGKFLKNDQNKQ